MQTPPAAKKLSASRRLYAQAILYLGIQRRSKNIRKASYQPIYCCSIQDITNTQSCNCTQNFQQTAYTHAHAHINNHKYSTCTFSAACIRLTIIEPSGSYCSEIWSLLSMQSRYLKCVPMLVNPQQITNFTCLCDMFRENFRVFLLPIVSS